MQKEVVKRITCNKNTYFYYKMGFIVIGEKDFKEFNNMTVKYFD